MSAQTWVNRGTQILKCILAVAGAISLLASTHAFAGATISYNTNSKSQGSIIGQQSSAAKGNGDVVSGNGTGSGFFSGDQTTSPGSRADEVHSAQSQAGEKGGHNH